MNQIVRLTFADLIGQLKAEEMQSALKRKEKEEALVTEYSDLSNPSWTWEKQQPRTRKRHILFQSEASRLLQFL